MGVEKPKQRRALVIFYPGCIEYEVMLALELLAPDSEIVVATPSGQAHTGHNGLVYQVQRSFVELSQEIFDVVLIPGGDAALIFALEKAELNPDLVRGLRHQAQNGALLAAICAGPLLLAASGLLTGRRYVHGLPHPEPEPVAEFFDGQFVAQAVVRDGNLITARPEAHIDFAATVIEALGLVGAEKARELAAYYRGDAGENKV